MAYTDVREAFKAMLAGFDPEQAEGLDVAYQINITGEGGGQWYLTVKGGQCHMAEGVHDSPNLTMTMSPETCLKWMNKEASGAKLFMTGEVQSQGNIMLAPKIEELFVF